MSTFSSAAPPAPRWTWRVLLASSLCTLALFLAVPLLETLRTLQLGDTPLVREMPMLPEAPPPPPPPDFFEEPPPPAPADTLPQPVLELPAAPPAMPLVPAFDMPFVHTPGEWRADPLQAGPVAPLAPSVFDVGQIDQAPTPRAQIRPLYPPRARLHRIEGWVDLEFVVTLDGNVEDLRVLQAHPDDTFTRSALQAAARWTFNPGRHEGQPVPVRVHQRISFELE